MYVMRIRLVYLLNRPNILPERLFSEHLFSEHLIRALYSTVSSEPQAEPVDDHPMFDKLYPGHIKTNAFQKSLLTIGSAVASLLNPKRDDMIATLGESSGYLALKYMERVMRNDEEGCQILREKPVIDTKTIDIEALKALPQDTFGFAYSQFLDKNGFSPDARRQVIFVDDLDLAYVMLRYRQIHDLVHTLIAMPPNMQGEVAVKWIEALHTGLPLCVLGAMFGPLRFTAKQRRQYLGTYLPWAVKTGVNTRRNLMCVYFERYWDYPMIELRNSIGLSEAPNDNR